MASFLVALVFFSLISIAAITLLFYLVSNFQPGSNKITKDLKQMKAEVDKWVSDLVPFKQEELEQLSLNQINQVRKKGLTTTAKGVFTTIYHEPVFLYAYKRYLGNGHNGILYARTSEREFLFRIRPKFMELRIDDQLIGQIKEGGLLYSARTDRLLAKIKEPAGEDLQHIIIGDQDVASLVGPEAKTSDLSRAFEIVRNNLTNDEELVLQALTIYELVKREIGE